MKVRSFLKLVELRTKVASISPLIIGSLFSMYYYNSFNLVNFTLMFCSLLCIDMATTAINNYYDYKKAIKKEGYNYQIHNAVVSYNLSLNKVRNTILTLIFIAICFGIALVIQTNIIVLLIGIISFIIGISYTFGPLPISRTPYGEILSGFFMGFVIIFLSVYIHNFDGNMIDLSLLGNTFTLEVNYLEVLKIFIFSLPSILFISNIMLANNICDIEDDIINKRLTLPIVIGKDKALKLFEIFYHIAFLDFLVLVLIEVLPTTFLAIFLIVPIIKKNIATFKVNQSKKTTFVLAVKNFMILSLAQILLLIFLLLFI